MYIPKLNGVLNIVQPENPIAGSLLWLHFLSTWFPFLQITHCTLFLSLTPVMPHCLCIWNSLGVQENLYIRLDDYLEISRPLLFPSHRRLNTLSKPRVSTLVPVLEGGGIIGVIIFRPANATNTDLWDGRAICPHRPSWVSTPSMTKCAVRAIFSESTGITFEVISRHA